MISPIVFIAAEDFTRNPITNRFSITGIIDHIVVDSFPAILSPFKLIAILERSENDPNTADIRIEAIYKYGVDDREIFIPLNTKSIDFQGVLRTTAETTIDIESIDDHGLLELRMLYGQQLIGSYQFPIASPSGYGL